MNTMDLLNDLLEDRGMTLYSLAKAAGVSYSTFDAARKRGGQLAVDTIVIICKTLKIPVYQFFMSDDDWEEIADYVMLKYS